jgi:hypothetical protein
MRVVEDKNNLETSFLQQEWCDPSADAAADTDANTESVEVGSDEDPEGVMSSLQVTHTQLADMEGLISLMITID